MIDWATAALSILKAAKKEDLKVDNKYIVVRPRILSDENYLRGVSVLRGVLTCIPPAAIASPILGLGAVGFNIWKHIALGTDYDKLEFPPIDPNTLRMAIEIDTELKKHYGDLITPEKWNANSIAEVEAVYNDFKFITDAQMLKAKYPQIAPSYISNCALVNKHNLQKNLIDIEQGLLKVSPNPEINHNIHDAFDCLKQLFPVMNDWSLFNSEGFKEIIDILDTIF